jgi:pilus assembly protein Flp/PilA
MLKKLKNFFKDEEGATMVEYALMLALIAVVCITAVQLIGTRANTTFNTSANALPTGT